MKCPCYKFNFLEDQMTPLHEWSDRSTSNIEMRNSGMKYKYKQHGQK